MMAQTFRCKHCGKIVRRNPRIKSAQRFCGKASCQQARKNEWEREKNRKDIDYRQRRGISKKRWRKHHSAHIYQHKYRESHPDYVQINREKQHNRNEKRKHSQSVTKIVKTDALISEKLINSGLYELLPYKKQDSEK